MERTAISKEKKKEKKREKKKYCFLSVAFLIPGPELPEEGSAKLRISSGDVLYHFVC